MLDTLLEFVGEMRQILDPNEVQDKLVEKNLAVHSGEKLHLDLVSGGAVSITGWDREELSIQVKIGGRGSKGSEVDISKTPDGVSINGHNPRRRTVFSENHSYLIQVPMRFDLELKSSGGNIQIANVSGLIKCLSMGGNIDLKNLRGEISIKTMGGNISLEDSAVNGTLETLGGKVRVRNVQGIVTGISPGGKVHYQ